MAKLEYDAPNTVEDVDWDTDAELPATWLRQMLSKLDYMATYHFPEAVIFIGLAILLIGYSFVPRRHGVVYQKAR